MFIIEKRLGSCCNSCCKTLNDNEECIRITTYWINAIGRSQNIMQMSLCKDCFNLLKDTINKGE